jgi:transposase
MEAKEKMEYSEEALREALEQLCQVREELCVTKGNLQQALQEIERLREQLRELGKRQEEEREQAQKQWKESVEDLRKAQEEMAELKKQKKSPPGFVKANKKKQTEKKPRKKRDAKYNRGRARSEPNEIVEHRVVNCPQCHGRLGGISLARVREVIDIPPPPPVVIRHHRIYQGWCSACQKWHEAPVDLHEEVLGQGRIGVRLASLIATLRAVMRLPLEQIRTYLETMHQVQISHGEVVELLHRIAKHTQPVAAGIKAQIQSSRAAQGDETCWREDGINGYIWLVCTPTLRYYEYHHSRSGDIIKNLIGEDFQGVLGSDFYGGYNKAKVLHQRCWVHLLGDIHDLKKLHPTNESLLAWAKAVREIYDEATAWAASGPDPGLPVAQQIRLRLAQQQQYEQRLLDLCRPFLHTDALQHTLCERIERFIHELFVFVAIPGVPSHNNLAERSLRPLVIARKISGGTRSPQGSQTRMTLATIFGTWLAQNLNPFQQCLLALLSIFPPLPPATA